ncbi:MAG: hypothetical protein VB858_20530, partial [Planctomycetaceae bacterium]
MHPDRIHFTRSALLAVGLSVLVQHSLCAQNADPENIEFFENKIRPVLLQHCYECHSADAKNVK